MCIHGSPTAVLVLLKSYKLHSFRVYMCSHLIPLCLCFPFCKSG